MYAGHPSLEMIVHSQSASPASDAAAPDAELLRHMLRTAELELARKDAEFRIMSGGIESLREEHRKLSMEIRTFSDQKQARSDEMRLVKVRMHEQKAKAAELELRLAMSQADPRRSGQLSPAVPVTAGSSDAPSPASTAGWRGKAALLEDELKAKAEIVARLRQRELWLEQQLRRQKDANDMPLEALLHEISGLREGADRLGGGQKTCAAPTITGLAGAIGSTAQCLPQAPSVLPGRIMISGSALPAPPVVFPQRSVSPSEWWPAEVAAVPAAVAAAAPAASGPGLLQSCWPEPSAPPKHLTAEPVPFWNASVAAGMANDPIYQRLSTYPSSTNPWYSPIRPGAPV